MSSSLPRCGMLAVRLETLPGIRAALSYRFLGVTSSQRISSSVGCC